MVIKNKKFCIYSIILFLFLSPCLQSSLIAYYNFNQSSGNTLPDQSGYNNTGTLFNMPGNWVSGQSGYGNALDFNNYDQYVSIANSSSLSITNAITVSAWINTDTLQAVHRRIVEKSYSSSWYFGIGASGGTSLSVWMNGAERSDTGANAFSLNQWAHIAFTYDRQFIRIYVNGVQKVASAYTAAIGLDTQDVWIGNWKGLNHYFDGLIDEVTIWNEALNASQINQLQNTGIIPEPASLFYIGLFLISLVSFFSKSQK